MTERSGPLEFQEFSAGGVRTYALTEGRHDGSPAVFLHGLPGASFIWQPVIHKMPRNVRVIAPDLPGWGKSVSSYSVRPAKLTPDFCVRWFEDLLTAQQIERFDLISHGTSALLAEKLVQKMTDRVRRLAFVNPQVQAKSGGTLLARVLGGGRWKAGHVNAFLAGEAGMNERAASMWLGTFQTLLRVSGEARRRDEAGQFCAAFDTHTLAGDSGRRRRLLLTGNRIPSPLDFASGVWETQQLAGGLYVTLDQPDECGRILAEFLGD